MQSIINLTQETVKCEGERVKLVGGSVVLKWVIKQANSGCLIL